MPPLKLGILVGTALWILLAAVGPLSVDAQEDRPRSETGRHKREVKPEPKPETAAKQVLSDPSGSIAAHWFVGFGGGVQGGGGLFQVQTNDGVSIPWVAAEPFRASRFNGTLGFDLALGLFVGYHLNDQWAVRLDLNSSRMDVSADALQEQQAAIFLYDRMTITTVGVAGEFRLVRLESYPYASLGLISRSITAIRESELDQQQWGFRLGFGYLKTLDSDFSVRAEVRYGSAPFDIGSFVPASVASEEPAIKLNSADSLNIFEILLAVQLNI